MIGTKDSFKRIYSEGVASEHPDIANQKEFANKADAEISRRKRERAKKAGPQLPGFVKSVKEQKDHEHSMARTEIHKIDNAIKTLKKKLKGEGNIEAWVQSKITRAADYLDAASNYLDSGEHDQVDEEYDDNTPEMRSRTVTDGSSSSTFSGRKKVSPGELVRKLNKDNSKQKKKKKLKEETMTSVQKAKEKRLKDKYDESDMKQNMIDQYGKEKGTQIYFAKIRKMAMEEKNAGPSTPVKYDSTMKQLVPNQGAGRPGKVRYKGSDVQMSDYKLEGQQIDEIVDAIASKVGPVINKGVDTIFGKPKPITSTISKPPITSATPKPISQTPQKKTYADLGREMRSTIDKRNQVLQQLRQSFDYEDAYNYIIEMLVAAEFAEDYEAAEVMFEHISDEFTSAILEEYIEEKARGTRKKTTVHAYDVDETLFGHGKKGKPNVQVHVKDASGKRVQSLSNQEFNTHKLDKGHSYDFSEFQSAKKFKETSSPNKKVIKDIKRKQARGQNVHLITARSKFDKPGEFQGHLKKHGIDVDKKNIHYTGGMKGGDIGKKKVDVANAVAKQSGAKTTHMYDDAAKVHKAFEKEKKENPTSKTIKTHMVAPDRSGESRIRSFQATKGGTTGGPEKTTKEKQRARKKARKNMGEEMTAYEYWKQFID